MRGWYQPATAEDLAVRLTAAATTRKPDLIEWPWDEPAAAPEPVEQEELARLTAILEARGGFRDVT